MSGINKVILVGHLGKDPEIKYLEGNVAKVNFTMATSEVYKDKTGARAENTEWHNIVLWRAMAENAEKLLKKGTQIYLEGKIQSREGAKVISRTKFLKEKIIKAPCDFTDEQREIITECIENINNKLIPEINECWINISKLLEIPWKIGVINSSVYEQGLPHTRDDTIILPNNKINLSKEFMDTLLHEKLHIYQKTYPDDFNMYLKKNDYIKYKKYIDTNIKYRSNPDTDEWIYKKNGIIYVSEYINDKPKTILDVKYNPKNSCIYEHPREKSVYDLLNKIKKNT
jgi:single-strand DNA-binding protein